MDEQAYQYWQVLHRRVALGETLTTTETEQQRLQAREAELDARIVALEARLDTRTRQLLGISN